MAGSFWFLRSAKASSCFRAQRRVLRVASLHLPLAPPFGEPRFSWSVLQSCSPCRSESLGIASALLLIITAVRIFWVSSYCRRRRRCRPTLIPVLVAPPPR